MTSFKKTLLKLVYGTDLSKGEKLEPIPKICQHDALYFRGNYKRKPKTIKYEQYNIAPKSNASKSMPSV